MIIGPYRLGLFSVLQPVERFIERAHRDPASPTGLVQLAEQQQVFEVGQLFETPTGPGAEAAVAVRVGLHVVGDEGDRALASQAIQRIDTGAYMVRRVDRLANVVHERSEAEFKVPFPLGPRQLEHLQAVVQRVALGVVGGVLLDGFEWAEQQP